MSNLLHEAVFNGDFNRVKTLLEEGANPNAPLDQIDTDEARAFTKKYIDYSTRWNGWLKIWSNGMLSVAGLASVGTIIGPLIIGAILYDTQVNRGGRPLQSRYSQYPAEDVPGYTPLYLAAERRHEKIAILLVQYGAQNTPISTHEFNYKEHETLITPLERFPLPSLSAAIATLERHHGTLKDLKKSLLRAIKERDEIKDKLDTVTQDAISAQQTTFERHQMAIEDLHSGHMRTMEERDEIKDKLGTVTQDAQGSWSDVNNRLDESLEAIADTDLNNEFLVQILAQKQNEINELTERLLQTHRDLQEQFGNTILEDINGCLDSAPETTDEATSLIGALTAQTVTATHEEEETLGSAQATTSTS